MATTMNEVAAAIRQGASFLVASHLSPDGDAIGSMSAMGHLLERLGKKAILYNASGAPEHFSWLDLPSPVLTELPAGGYDWIIALDCGDHRRGGKALQEAMERRPTAVVDHHLDNPLWGAANWVDTGYSSTCEMVAGLADAFGVELTGALGEAVYVGVVTDTGNFSFENASPRSMELAARIVRLGLSPARVNELIQNQWSPGRFRLWGEVLGSLAMHFDGQLGVIRITKEQLDRLGATAADTDGLTNFVLRIKGCKAAMSLREDAPGELKLSLRSVSHVNIQPVAASLGGGGHRCAAGASLRGDVGDVEPGIVKALGEALARAGEA